MDIRHFRTVKREDDRKLIPQDFKRLELAILRFPDNLRRHIAPGKMLYAAIHAKRIIPTCIGKLGVPYLDNPDVFFAATFIQQSIMKSASQLQYLLDPGSLE